jgi:hypothetical protein
MKARIKLFLVPLLVGCLLAQAEIYHGLVGGYLYLALATVLAVRWLWMLPRKLKALPVLLAALMVCVTVQAQSMPVKDRQRQENLGLPGAIIVGAVVVVAGYYLYRWLYHFADTRLNPPPPSDGGTNQPPGSATE